MTSSGAAPSGEKRKEIFHQQHSFHHSKRHKSFNDQHLGNGRNGKPQLGGASDRKVIKDRHGKERVFFCSKCPNNHPGKDCSGNLVECKYCGKLGHRDYECFASMDIQLNNIMGNKAADRGISEITRMGTTTVVGS